MAHDAYGDHKPLEEKAPMKENALSYLIELRTPESPATDVLAQAESRDGARALIDAQLERVEDMGDVEIVAVHTIH
jgi:hypothetical protein